MVVEGVESIAGGDVRLATAASGGFAGVAGVVAAVDGEERRRRHVRRVAGDAETGRLPVAHLTRVVPQHLAPANLHNHSVNPSASAAHQST